ncbi:MAG: hypothetical protein JJE39_04335 [Vicinamibacteria bacterium]|nr:hypothetical protein [Vicinamibacteria bacterium]
MTPEEFERERRLSAEALRLVTENAREEDKVRNSEIVLGAVLPVKTVRESASLPAEHPTWNPPAPPDLRPVNESWPAGGTQSAGRIAGLVDGSLEKNREAQVRFNSDQVQLDNALVTWTADHFAATHKHYDAVIDSMQRRMNDIDTRHRELERELVRHVHEMAQRIDVVLGEGEKGRVSHEAALRSLRDRLRLLEEKLG